MIHEVITFMIIGAAIALAIAKSVRKLKNKKLQQNKPDFNKETFTKGHNCPDCSAECMLRNASKLTIDKNKELCREIEIRQKS
ncbi:MAG: hypothetical protein FD181_3005 [Prolixibacteraceae bacterium]|nr:MAG: hypothetical protein FD181_3005 [Prolixibacteraceae bacterium]